MTAEGERATMSDTRAFDLLSSPLEGTNLIEASAGTGKTYTVTALFLRLVLEKGLPVDRILVVTFTEAATEELKQRIRSRLRVAAHAFGSGRSSDPFLAGLIGREPDPRRGLRRFEEALRGFDQAAVTTIHGFCRRVLYENAFESGSLFDTELAPLQTELKREIVEDFWRLHLYTASPLFASYCLSNRILPETLMALLPNRIALAGLRVIPRAAPPDTAPLEVRFKASFRDLATAWSAARNEVEEILLSHVGLNRNIYRKAKVPAWIRRMDEYASSGAGGVSLFDGYEKFTAGCIEKAAKQGVASPAHPFFDGCERHLRDRESLADAFRRVHMGLVADLLEYAEAELAARGRRKNTLGFDDLLLSLRKALSGDQGDALARAVNRQFKAALIDEFQDTDPVQYGIIDRVFGGGDGPLFLIGDPKQAIYSFRGADIFAYMKAAKTVSNRYTLGENWRSGPELVSAVNAVFSTARRPFVHDGIPFHPAKAAAANPATYLNLNGRDEPPLVLWLLNARDLTGTDSPVAVERASEIIASAVAGEISRLLRMAGKGRARLGDRALKEEDMAVLVRRNDEALLIQKHLTARNIPSVVYGTGDLFDTREAMEMKRLLAGIADPDDEPALRAALSTAFMGVRGEALEALSRDPEGWEARVEAFNAYRDVWARRGFIQMFRGLLARERVLSRLMAFPDGERRATNLLHLSEVLQRTAMEQGFGMAELLQWLSDRSRPGAVRPEEHLLRLESDDRAVRVITVHKSKGLEYPVVFCPYAWHGSRVKDPFVLYHDEREGLRLTMDMGSPDQDAHRRKAEEEALSENLRLLYVALTRAKARCCLVWGRVKGAETSAPAFLFHADPSLENGGAVNAAAASFTALDDSGVEAEVRQATAAAGRAIRICALPPRDVPGEIPPSPHMTGDTLACPLFRGTIRTDGKISSFSSLIAGMQGAGEAPDHDAVAWVEDDPETEPPVLREAPPVIHDFPRGARAGVFMHDLLEHLAFGETAAAATQDLISEKLAAYGFGSRWRDAVLSMLRNVVNTPLDPSDPGFTLSRIPETDRLNELEFTFPLKPVSPGKLERLFGRFRGAGVPDGLPERLGRLEFAPSKGFMKGFMDLVFRRGDRFYLVDWKSNHLGDAVEDYDRAALKGEMEARAYGIQYALYSLALDLYLRRRLKGYDYQRHFGGVFYIFLRGVNAEKGSEYGIYRERITPELMAALRRELVDVTGRVM